MSYQLGVDLGTTYTAAAVRRGEDVRIVHLGTRSAAIPSVVLLKEDETFLVGEAAQRRGATEPQRLAREFKRRLGDTTPLILGATPYSAEALMARLLRWVVEEVSQREGGPPASVAVTYPANWGEYKKDLLQQAIRLADIEHATLITEPEAAALHYASKERVDPGRIIAVYDLGGGTFDAAILRKTEVGFEYLGNPEGIERLGGIDFDEAVFEHTRRALEAAGAFLDPDDPQTVAALRRLRDECTDAKEALSADSDAAVPVILPTVQTDVRLTRTELEAMIRPSLSDTIGAMHRAVRGAGLELGDIDAVLLVGGSSRIPLVGELVAGELGRPVVVDAHPKHAIALGAALSNPTAGGPTPQPATEQPLTPPPAAPAPAAQTTAAAAEPTEQPLTPPPAAPAPAAQTTAAAAEATEQPLTPPPVAPAPAAQTIAGAPTGEPTPQPPAEQPVRPPPAASAAAATAQHPATVPSSSPNRGLLIGVGLAVVVVVAAVAAFALSGGDDGTVVVANDVPASEAVDQGQTDDQQVVVAPLPSTTRLPEPTATTAPEPTATASPTPAPTPTPPPTATPLPFPIDTRRAELTSIALAGSVYEVAYDTINFEPVIGGAGTYHLHFHWDIYPPDTVGTNASPQNPWAVWATRNDGAKIFDQFGPAAIPVGASAICAVVATDTHGVDEIQLANDTVTCMDVPPG